jgi:uracil-DNA glycosylase
MISSAEALEHLRAEIASDPSNAWAKDLGYQPLYTAAPSSRIAVIGQAPGRRAQEKMTPWNDPSGVRLRSWLDIDVAVFYDADSIALLPMDFYYPGKGTHGDLPPRKDFAPLWHPKIIEQMPDLRLTILIGGYAQTHYLASRVKPTLTETVRAYREYGPAVIPLVHPSPLNFRWMKKNPWFDQDVVPELRRLVHAALTT